MSYNKQSDEKECVIFLLLFLGGVYNIMIRLLGTTFVIMDGDLINA
jgi:hypothetical protein